MKIHLILLFYRVLGSYYSIERVARVHEHMRSVRCAFGTKISIGFMDSLHWQMGIEVSRTAWQSALHFFERNFGLGF